MDFQNLSDNDYFSRYVDCFNFLYKDNKQSEIMYIKDSSFCYQAISSNFINIVKTNATNDVIGKTDYQLTILKQYSGLCDRIRAQDQKVIETQKRHFFLHVTTAKNAFVARKSPIINPATGNCVGVQGQMANFLMPHTLKILYKINNINFGILNQSQETQFGYKLTERQHMVLFLYLHRYSYSEIAVIMSTLGHQISAGRVNDHLENLKYIFVVKSKEQLIEKALSLNYHLFIPRKFLKIGTYDLDDELIISDE